MLIQKSDDAGDAFVIGNAKAVFSAPGGGYILPVSNNAASHGVERLFPFVLRSRILLIGRETLRRSKGRLHFVLVTLDISDTSREEILRDFTHYPVVQHYVSADLERHFGIRGAKVIGFAKSGLAQSIYAELKSKRINLPAATSKPAESSPAPPSARKARPKPASPRQDQP